MLKGREGAERSSRRHLERGGTLIVTLVFLITFVVIFVSLSGFILRTHRESTLQVNDELAFQAAESGLDYARWRLAHDPDNFDNETRVLSDQFAGELASYDLVVTAPSQGSSVVELAVTGRSSGLATREVTLKARYGRPSLARFASVTNSDVWYGGQINGAVHANGGIRMDGTSQSLMTSAQETYSCQPYHGCSNPFETKPGVWGSGQTASLWDYPVSAVNYNSITLDLLDMKTAAQASNTYYGPSTKFGYRVVFNSDNTYTISRVTRLRNKRWSYTNATGWQYLSHDIRNTTHVETRTVPSNGVIYVEDTAWVEGDIRDRVTVVAGVFPDVPSTNADVILNGSISYNGVNDGSRSFAAVAQRHVLIPYSGAPDNMVLEGAFVAQKGAFHRRYYSSGSHRLKSSLTRYGMIASNEVPATAWVSGSPPVVVSGFQSGSATYDPNFLYQPPPFFPADGQFEFISWEEEQ